MRARRAMVLATALLAGSFAVACGGDDDAVAVVTPPDPPPPDPPPSGCEPGTREHPAGGCCDAGTVPEADGSCRPAGVSTCGDGFERVGDACEPILPSAACAPGQFALPGETACHPVADCGSSTWGSIDVSGSTQFVDGSFVGTPDGSSVNPWTTLADAIAAAADGDTIAVAAGQYDEQVTVARPLTLWGRCPDMVTITPPDVADAVSVFVTEAADGALIRGIAATGGTRGVFISGANTRVLEVWIHDTDDVGMLAGPKSSGSELSDSLVEMARGIAVLVQGSDLSVSRSVVRDTLPRDGGVSGMGIAAWDEEGVRSSLDADGVLVERSVGVGVVGSYSDVVLRNAVVRDTAANSNGLGWGVSAQGGVNDGERGSLDLSDSLVEGSHDIGVWVSGSEGSVSSTVVRGTRASTNGKSGGIGVFVQPFVGTDERGQFSLRDSLVDDNQFSGVYVYGSDGEILSTLVRDTVPGADDHLGRGIYIEARADDAPPVVSIDGVRVERCHDTGIGAVGGDTTIEGSYVGSTVGNGVANGRGIALQIDFEVPSPGGSVSDSVVERSGGLGIAFTGVGGSAVHNAVRDTMPTADGRFGDAIVAQRYDNESPLVRITDNLVSGSARIGVGAFGGTIELGDSLLDCNQIDLNGQLSSGVDYQLDDLGGNVCGCGDVEISCAIQSAGVEPPTPSQ